MRKIVFAIVAIAFFSVGTAYANDTAYRKGVDAYGKKDYVEARKQWTQSLADGGPDEALNNLAYLLYYGLGGEAQPEKAVELWRKGAALSVSEAQLFLGLAYEEGKGINQNLIQAYAWYRCANVAAGKLAKENEAERDIESRAGRYVAELSARLTKADLEEAESIATNLISKYAVRLNTELPK